MVRSNIIAVEKLSMWARVSAFVRDESGATAIEYGLMIAMVTLVVVGTWRSMGDSLTNLFTLVSGELSASIASVG
jgi:pilus assembly protein Flp/PilA